MEGREEVLGPTHWLAEPQQTLGSQLVVVLRYKGADACKAAGTRFCNPD